MTSPSHKLETELLEKIHSYGRVHTVPHLRLSVIDASNESFIFTLSEPSIVRVEVRSGIASYEMHFSWPSDKATLNTLLRMLSIFFDAGEDSMRKKFRDLIGAASSG